MKALNIKSIGVAYGIKTMKVMVRNARLEDALGIHNAHMHSIQTLCAKDYAPEQIEAWGGRPFVEAQRVAAIQNHDVWVVELEGKIEGYGHLRIYDHEGVMMGHIMALYLTPKVVGKNLGREICDLMVEEARRRNVKRINLESTLTSHGFYEKMGFCDGGDLIQVTLAGTCLACHPMYMDL